MIMVKWFKASGISGLVTEVDVMRETPTFLYIKEGNSYAPDGFKTAKSANRVKFFRTKDEAVRATKDMLERAVAQELQKRDDAQLRATKFQAKLNRLLASEKIPAETQDLVSEEHLAKFGYAGQAVIRARCGELISADGLECPKCGTLEVYKDATDVKNVDRWYFNIKAYRVDNQSYCGCCNTWFG